MDKNSILNVYSAVARLKSSDDVLIYGDYTPLSAGGDVFAFKRTLNGKTYYIYHNFGSRTVNISGNSGEILYSLNNATKTSLPGYSSLIVG
jgi:glycosidase